MIKEEFLEKIKEVCSNIADLKIFTVFTFLQKSRGTA